MDPDEDSEMDTGLEPDTDGEVSGTADTDGVPSDRASRVTEAAKRWVSQLTDLGGRNQLLFYRDLRRGTLELTDADPTTMADLLAGHAVRLSRLFEPDDLPDRCGRARAVRNRARAYFEERGISVCYLAIGMATWTNTQSAATPAAPVLLREASITARGVAEDDFEIVLTGDTEVNPTLVHLLQRRFATEIDPEDLLALLPADQSDPTGLFGRLVDNCAGVPGFAVKERTVLGTFSYAKMPMVADLENNVEAMVEHDIVAAIAGDRQAHAALAGGGVRVDLSDPDRTPPADEFLVLDADSSQNYAINAAISGRSVIVSGPPGTGKSQTIANLVATLVARGQSVLFVAEKRAAIAAVLGRLDRVGLGDLVLDLHGGAGSMRRTTEQLADGLRAAGSIALPDQDDLHRQVVTTRQRLNAHAEALHRIREPWGISVFDARANLIGLRLRHGGSAVTDIAFDGPTISAIDRARFGMLQDQIEEYAELGGLTLTPDEHAWVGASVSSTEQAEDAWDTLRRLYGRTLPETRHCLDAVLEQTGLPEPESLTRWHDLFELLHAVTATLDTLDPAVFTGPLPEMVAATASRAWRRANPDLPGVAVARSERRRTRKAARTLWRGPAKPDRRQLHSALVAADEQRAIWVRRCHGGGVPRCPQNLAGAVASYHQLTTELDHLGSFLPGADLAGQNPTALETTLVRLVRDEATLRKLPRLAELDGVLTDAGLAPLVAWMRARSFDPSLAVAAFEHCWYTSVLERVGFADHVLTTFDGSRHTSTARKFREADANHVAQTAVRVRRAAAERLIAVTDAHPEQAQSVEKQARRKRGHLPLRRLFAAAPEVMTALKPCWAMSPLVVSQLLPGDRPYFDVVIFDEASQIVPAEAVPAILRGHRVVVAGDPHQLPPTNFFGASDDGGDDSSVGGDGSMDPALTSGYESILDVLTAVLGGRQVRSLRWHYRSRDERLIAFANHWIYDGSLISFPGVAGADCLTHILVEQQPSAGDGTDSVGAEVRRVVDLVCEHARTRPRESLGVITMGVKHADRIDTALRAVLAERPDLHAFFERDDEPFFVKNLERVQGDERDAIILSIGYGKTPDGRLPYRFGPLLQEGGERRLNVAITRARSRMTVVSSFSHHDMDPDRSKAPGVMMLRAYLQYTSSGGVNLGDLVADRPALNPFEISVRDRLTAAGIPLVAQYGVAGYWIDFAAKHPTKPGRMVLAIEADGASYHSSYTARDRDRLRQEHLERLGWIFHRIWSKDWFDDPETCVARARTAYEHAIAAGGTAVPNPPRMTEDTTDVDGEMATTTGRMRDRRPGVRAGSPITEYSDRQLAALLKWIESDTLLRTREQLLGEFMSELGFQRRGTRIIAAFDRALRRARPSKG